MHECSIALLTKFVDMPTAVAEAEHQAPQCRIVYVALLDYAKNCHTDLNMSKAAIGPVSCLAKMPEVERVFFCPKEIRFELYDAVEQLSAVGITSFYVTDVIRPYDFDPQFFTNHWERAERIFHMLADDASKNVFASRLKTTVTGNNGYRIVSVYPEYQHPLVHAKPGHTVIDGGVGGAGKEGAGTTAAFAEAVGPTGHVYAFEPEPVNFNEAQSELAAYRNVVLSPHGLWSNEEEVQFVAAGRNNLGSHILPEGQKPQNARTFLLPMTTLDRVVANYNLNRLDLVKLDIEGAELDALRGGIRAIQLYRPDLMVSLYHKKTDILALPEFLAELDLGYKLFIGHHMPLARGTVLYATARDS